MKIFRKWKDPNFGLTNIIDHNIITLQQSTNKKNPYKNILYQINYPSFSTDSMTYDC